MNGKDIIQRLFEKFRFAEPMPDDVRRGMPNRKKAGLVSILRMKKKYGIFTAPVIWLFFLARRMGITLSMAMSSLVVWSFIILIIGSTTIGLVYTVKYFLQRDPVAETEVAPGNDVLKADGKNAFPAASHGEGPPVSLGVVPFEFVGVDPVLADQVTRKIGGRIIVSRGARKVVYVGSTGGATKAKSLLLGAVVRVGGGYRITARVVDSSSTRIIAFASENISSVEELDDACGRISAKVQGAVE